MPFKVKNLSFAYGQNKVLDGLSLTLTEGKCSIIRGENGSGKSTLVKILAGIIPAFYKGDLQYDGDGPENIMCILQNTEKQLLCQYAGEELDFFHKYSKSVLSKEDAQKLIKDISGKKISELSSGQKQKTVIACAAVCGGRVVLMDEPSACLDASSCGSLLEVIDSFKKEGLCVLIVTHDEERMAVAADEIYCLENGKLVACKKAERVNEKEIKPQAFSAELFIRAAGIKHSFGGRELFNGFSCEIKGGVATALCGPNASGKTTLCKILSGRLKPVGGAVKINGKEFGQKELLKNVKLITYNPYTQLLLKSVQETIDKSRLHAIDKETEKEFYSILEIDRLLGKDVDELSWGQAQRLLFYKNIITMPKLLILDEVFSSIDIKGLALFLKALILFLKHGGAVLIVSHSENQVNSFCAQRITL